MPIITVAAGRRVGTCVGFLLLSLAFVASAQAAPTANNQNLGKLGPGKELLFALSYTGSPTSFTIVTNPGHGTLRPYGTSNPQYYYYKANTGYEGADSFTWKCADASGDSNVATCSVTISSVPVANNQNAAVVIGGEVQVYLSYSDPMGDKTRTFTILSGPAHGTLQTYLQKYGYDYPGYYFYKAAADYTGSDAFTWKMNNGYADSGTGTVSITVNANTAPVANNYSSTVSSSTRSSVYLSVTHPSSDSGQTMTYTLVSGPSHGTVEMPAPTTANGAYAYYTSAKDYVGGDSLTWKVSDGIVESGVATATITVNGCTPVPQNQTEKVRKDATNTVQAAYTGGGGYTYSVIKVTNPSHGAVSVAGTKFIYAPTAGYTGSDSFTWKMSYSNATTVVTNTATVTCSLVVKDGISGTAYDQNVLTLKGVAATAALGHGFCQAPVFSIVTAPAHGTTTLSGGNFTYTPAAGYAGTDWFTWKMNDGTADSNVATCKILVRAENSRGGMTVLLVVKDTLLPEITNEVARWQADLIAEGYAAKIKSWSSTDAAQLWSYLVSEYETIGQFVCGATLIGNLPTATGMSSGETTDYAFMNMLTFRDNGSNKQHIWVSRIWTVGFAGGEVKRAKWAMDANHGYRAGTHRLPYGAYWYDSAYGQVNEGNAVNTLIVWPTIEHLYPMDAFRKGGEFENSEIHSDGAFSGFDSHPSQLRYSTHSSCGPGRLGGPVNQNSCTYGGGVIMSMGSTATAYSGQNVVMDNITYFNALAAGDTFGNGMVRPNLNPYGDCERDMFYGDLSLPAKAAPSNAIPVISAFTSDKSSGSAPLTVNFAVAASDPDGVVSNYEWFVNGFNQGVDGPVYSGPATNRTHTFVTAHRYSAEVQAVDNWKARAWSSKEIVVGPTPDQAVRVWCGKNFGTYASGWDYTDLATNVWLHDQAFAGGTWGYSGGDEGYVASAVAGTEDDILYQRFRTGSSFTYKVPVVNGGYWLRLKLADMQSTAVGQRVMDVVAEGATQVYGLDVFAQVGAKTATTVEIYVDVADGELTFTVSKNAVSANDIFLNCFEVVPYSTGNRPPLAESKNVTTMHDTPAAITLSATDPDGDAVSFALMSQPAHGTLSGTPPNLTYAPDMNYVGTDLVTFRANDGSRDGNIGAISITVGGLAAWWRLDETSGTAAADATGMGHTGTLQGGAAWTNGKIGGALATPASTNKMLVSPAVSLSPSWTITAWFTAPLPNTATWHTLTRAQNGDHQVITDGSLNLGMYDNTSGGAFRGCGYKLIGLSTGWHHVAAIGTGSVTRFYVDGAMVGTSDRKSSTDVYAVGNYQGDGQQFADKIDDVRIYNCAISAGQIGALAAGGNLAPTAAIATSRDSGEAPLTVDFDAGGSWDADGTIVRYAWSFGDRQGVTGATASHTYALPGCYSAMLMVTDDKGETDCRTVTIKVSALAACWTLDDGAGTTAKDSACGNNGTLANGPVWTTGKVGGGLSFDGVNDSVSVGTAAYAGVVNSFTIAFWAKPQATRATTTESASGAVGTSGQRYAIYPTHGNGAYGTGHAGAGVSVGTNGVSVFEHADGYLPSVLVYDVPLTNWTHVAVVYANGRPTLYLNGIAVRTGVASGKTVHPGCCMGGSSYGWYQGTLDDVRIYHGGLGDEAIAGLAAGVDAYGIPDAWKIQYFGSTTNLNSGALDDPDHDGMSNLAECRAGTNPTNGLSLFKVTECEMAGNSNLVITWLSVAGKYYTIRGTTNLLLGFPILVTNHVAGTPPANSCTVTVDQTAQRFYRVLVEP